MIIPIGALPDQALYLLEKIEGKARPKAILPVRFVPMTGEASRRSVNADQVEPERGLWRAFPGSISKSGAELMPACCMSSFNYIYNTCLHPDGARAYLNQATN